MKSEKVLLQIDQELTSYVSPQIRAEVALSKIKDIIAKLELIDIAAEAKKGTIESMTALDNLEVLGELKFAAHLLNNFIRLGTYKVELIPNRSSRDMAITYEKVQEFVTKLISGNQDQPIFF